MKKYLIAFSLLFIFKISSAQNLPTVPDQVEYTDVSINLNYDAKQKVTNEVKKLLTPDNSFLNTKIERIQLYLPLVERILEEERVPDDLKYVAILESDLKSNLISTSNAVGFWQFKSETGQELDLEISSIVDERENIASATKAAAIYFKKNNQVLKNWVSSTLAFNLGLTGAQKEIPENWKNSKSITFDGDTDPYLIKVVATRIAFEYKINRAKDSDLILIEYPTNGISLTDISKGLNVDYSLLQQYNTWLKVRNIPTNKEYMVVFPVRIEDEEKIYAAIDQMPKPSIVVATTKTVPSNNQTKNKTNTDATVGPKTDGAFPELTALGRLDPDPRNPSFYTINGKKGILAKENMTSLTLADVAKIRVYKFLKFNDLTDKDLLIPNEVYYLQRKNNKAKVPLHTTRKGESLWQISQDYGVKLNKLLKYNRMVNVMRLQEGQIVYLQKKRPKGEPVQIAKPIEETTEPENDEISRNSDPVQPVNETIEVIYSPSENSKVDSNPPSTPSDNYPKNTSNTTPTTNSTTNNSSAGTNQHRVKIGETLFMIAKTYNVKVEDIKAWNQLPDNDIAVNQILIIKNANPKTGSVNKNKAIDDDSEYGEKVTVIESTSKEYVNETPAGNRQQHVVKAGETLYSISKMYNTSVENLQKYNNMTDYRLSTGQKIWVSSPTAVVVEKTTKTISAKKTHQVKAGETLFSISKLYNTSIESLMALNNLSNNAISVGQKLIVQQGEVSAEKDVTDIIYTVVRGDTLFSIANKYGVSITDLQNWNNLDNNAISVGQKLLIKK